jgi:hypothetical protein
MEATIASPELLNDLGAGRSIREHCAIHGLIPALATGVVLARSCFSPKPRISLSLSVDPDGGPERLIVDIKVACSVDEAVAAYDRFLPRWIAGAARGDREKIVVVYGVA